MNFFYQFVLSFQHSLKMDILFERLLGEFTLQRDNEKALPIVTFGLRENGNFLQIEQCVDKMLLHNKGRKKLFHRSLWPALGHFVALLLQSFGTDSDLKLRLSSGNFLCRLTQYEFVDDSADFVAFVLPGIFARCRQIVSNALPELHSLDMIRCACKLLTNAICVSFSQIDANVPTEQCTKLTFMENVLSFRRDSNWIEMAAQRIFPQVASALSHLSLHSIDNIRFESVNILSKIRQQIPSDRFGRHFDLMTIDLAVLLYRDSMAKTRELAHWLVEDVRTQQGNLFESHILDKLKKTMNSLERDVKNASDGAAHLNNFVNCVQLVGSPLLQRLFNLPEFVDKFLSPLTRLISIDHSKEMICDAHSFDHGAPKGRVNLPPLKFGLNVKQFEELAALLADLQNSERLFEWCFDNFRLNYSAERRLSIAYFSFLLLDELREGHQSADHFVEDVLQMLVPMESLLEGEVSDHRITNGTSANSTESSLTQLLLHCLSTFRCQSNDMFSARLYIDVIYELLKWCSSSNFGVKNAAECALSRLADSHAHPDISALLHCHAQQIIFKLSLDARDFSARPRFPLIFAEMVSKCSADQTILPQIWSVVTELLLWLDRSDQKRVILLAKALRAYLNALNKWFPAVAPCVRNRKEEDDNGIEEEEGGRERTNAKGLDANRPLVQEVVTILNRTKHFISSAHLPLLLIILDILGLSLQFVRNYEDELLPMIHQNWHGLVRMFDVGSGRQLLLLDSQKIVLVKATEIVSCICNLSKDFVYWKIVHEFIPRIVTLMRILLRESQNLGKMYAQTATYKLQCVLLERMPVILEQAKVASQYFEPLEEVIRIYHVDCERKLPQRLRENASIALNQIKQIRKT